MPRFVRTLLAVGVVTVGLVVGGCTSDPTRDPTSIQLGGPGTGAPTDPGRSGPTPAACPLVSNDQVTAILQAAQPDEGTVTVTSAGSFIGDSSTCEYTWSGAMTTGKDFQIDVIPADTLDMVADPSQRQPIAGIGDDAFQAGEGNFYAVVGNWAVHVVNVQITDDVSTQLLATAAGRLNQF